MRIGKNTQVLYSS